MAMKTIVLLAVLLTKALSYHPQQRRWQRISTSITPQSTSSSSSSSSTMTSMPDVSTVYSVMDIVRTEGFRDWDAKKHR